MEEHLKTLPQELINVVYQYVSSWDSMRILCKYVFKPLSKCKIIFPRILLTECIIIKLLSNGVTYSAGCCYYWRCIGKIHVIKPFFEEWREAEMIDACDIIATLQRFELRERVCHDFDGDDDNLPKQFRLY